MSVVQTENPTHNANVAAAESMRQTAVAGAGGNQVTIRSAEITFYRACLASAVANKCGAEPFMVALRGLGVYS